MDKFYLQLDCLSTGPTVCSYSTDGKEFYQENPY